MVSHLASVRHTTVSIMSIGCRRLRPNWFALNLSNILILQRRDCSRGNFFAPFLHEMSGINEFERLRTAAYVTTKRAHDRRSEDRISHADRHDARSSPFVAPELPGCATDCGTFAVDEFRHQVGKLADAPFIANIRIRRVVGGGPRKATDAGTYERATCRRPYPDGRSHTPANPKILS